MHTYLIIYICEKYQIKHAVQFANPMICWTCFQFYEQSHKSNGNCKELQIRRNETSPHDKLLKIPKTIENTKYNH